MLKGVYMPINGIIFLFLSVFIYQSVSASDVDYSYPIQSKNQLDFDVVYVNDESGISVLDFTGDYSRQVNGQYNAAARQALLDELYNHVEDDFDFVVIFTDFPVESGEAAAFYGAIKNDVEGIGIPVFNYQSQFSSEHLQGIIDMTELSDWNWIPSHPEYSKLLMTLTHEFMHRWGPKVSFMNAGSTSDLLLGRDLGHWNYFLNSQASVMYGSLWEDQLDSSFKTTAIRKSLSPLDLYLMGMIEAQAVPDFFLIKNGTPGDREDLPPFLGTIATGTKQLISIDDVLAAEGQRIPNMSNAQHKFKLHFVLLKRPEQEIKARDIGRMLVLQKQFQTRFQVETSGVGQIYYQDNIPNSGQNSTLPYDFSTRSSFDLNMAKQFLFDHFVNQNGAYWADKPVTVIRDTSQVIPTLELLDEGSILPDSITWLNEQSAKNNDDMAWMVLSGILSQDKQNSIVIELQNNRNNDGGWGINKGSSSTPYDTALVLLALKKVLGNNFDPDSHSRLFLRDQLNDNAGAGYSRKGVSNLAVSATLYKALHKLSGFDNEIQPLGDYIASLQQPNDSFGNAYDTIIAIDALSLSTEPNHSVSVSNALIKLNTMQSIDGSFEGSVYTTAMAMVQLAGEQRPDISIMEVHAASLAVEGEEIAVNVHLQNSGFSETGSFRLSLMGDSGELDYHDIDTLLPDEESRYNLVFSTTGFTGEQVLTIKADAHDQVAETSELNNEVNISVELTAQTDTPELAIQTGTIIYQPQFFDTLPFVFSIEFDVVNLSTSAVNDVEVGLFSEDEYGNIQNHAMVSVDLSANMSSQIEFESSITGAIGDSNLLIIVDPNQLIVEVNEDNNQFDIVLPQIATVDLQILEEDVTLPAVFIKGQEQSVNFDFRNLGTQITPGFDVIARIETGYSNEILYENTVTELVGGEVVNRQFVWVPDEIGSYTLTLSLDDVDTVSEVNENNNEVQFSIEVLENSLTNIFIDPADVTLTPDPGLSGEDNQLLVNIQNNSNISVSNFSVHLFEQFPDGSQVFIGEQQIIDSVSAGGFHQVSMDLLNSHYIGDTTFVVMIDADEQVAEFNENDNLVIKQFRFLSKPDAMVTPGGMALSPTQPIPDENILLSLDVTNLGEQVLSNLTVDWYAVLTDDSSQWIGQTSIAEVSGGDSETSQFNYMFPTDIAVKGFLVRVDEGNQISESNEQNNEALQLITQQDEEFYLTDDVFSPNGDGVQDITRFIFNTSTTDDYSIAVYDFRDRLIKQFENLAWQNTQAGDMTWDGRDDKNRIVSDGDYRVSLQGINTGLSKHLIVSVDTNRTTIFESMVNATGTFYDLRCITQSDLMQGDFGLNKKYYFTEEYWDVNNNQQKGLFKIKTDASEIKSILPSAIPNPSFIQFSENQGTKPIADGGIILRYYKDDDRLYKVNSMDESYQVLNTSGLTDYRLEAVYDDFSVIRVNYQDYYKVYYDLITPPQLLNFQSEGGNINSLIRFEQVWTYKTDEPIFDQGEFVDYPVYIAPLDSLDNYTILSDSFQSSHPVNISYDSETKALLSQSGHQIKLYQSFGYELSLIREMSFDSTILKAVFLNKGRLLTVNESQILIFDQNGNQMGDISHGLSRDYFQQLIIDRYGSLDNMVAETECGNVTHSYLDLDKTSIQLTDWVLNQSSDSEIYLDFKAQYSAKINVQAPQCDIDYYYLFDSDNQSKLNLKITFTDDGSILYEFLDQFQIQEPKEVAKSQLIERQSPYFSMDNDIYLKNTTGVPSQYPTNLWEDYDLVGLDKNKVFKPKMLINSSSSPNAHRCSQAGEPALGFYQGTDNLTAFITAKSNQSGIEIDGSAFDRHLKNYTIEARKIDDPNSHWQTLITLETPKIQQRLHFWTPTRAGNYQIRLIVTDLAGNQLVDNTRVYFGQRSLAVANFNVSPIYFSPDGDGYKDEVVISFDVLKATEVLVEVINMDGDIIASFVNQYSQPQSNVQITWNGLQDNNELAESGAYQIKVNGFYETVSLDLEIPGMVRKKYFPRPLFFPLVSPVFHSHTGPIEVPNYTYVSNIETSTVERNLQKFNEVNQLWESANHPYPFHFDQFSPIITDDIYREKLTDKAGNVGFTMFNYNNNATFENNYINASSIRNLNSNKLKSLNLSKDDCKYPRTDEFHICGFNIQTISSDSEILNTENDNQIVINIQTLSAESVERIKLDIFADNIFIKSKEVQILPRMEAEQFLENHEFVEGSVGTFPTGVTPLKQKGKRYYVYTVELSKEDLEIDYIEKLQFNYSVEWDNNVTAQTGFSITKPISEGNGILFDSTEQLFLDKKIPNEILIYNQTTDNTSYDEFMTTTWNEFIEDVNLKPNHNYYIKYEIDSSVNAVTTNNHLNIVYKDTTQHLDILPIKELILGDDEFSFSIILFEKKLLPCKELDEIEWIGINSDGYSRALSAQLPLISPIFCPEIAIYNQLFNVGELCDQSAAPDTTAELLFSFEIGLSSEPIAFAEVYVQEDNEKITLMTDTNPFVENGLLNFNLEINKGDFISGEVWVWVDLVSSEGNKQTYNVPLLIQHENVEPQLVSPSNGDKFCAQAKSGIVDIPISTLVSNGSNHHFQVIASWPGNNKAIANDGRIELPEINYRDNNLLFDNGLNENLRQVGSDFYEVELSNSLVPDYSGPLDINIETLNTTGVSVCHTVTIDVDALVEGQVEIPGNKSKFYLSPNGDGWLDSDMIANVTADEQLTINAEIYQDNTLLGVAESINLSPGQDYDLNWDGYLDSQVLPDGEYEYKITLIDLCGLSVSEKVTVVIDTIIPEFLFITPEDNDQVPGIFDAMVFIDEVNFDNEALELGYDAANIFNPIETDIQILPHGSEFTHKISGSMNLSGLPLGSYPLTIKATDLAGNKNEASITVHRVDPQEIIWQFQRSPSIISPNNDTVKDKADINVGLNQQATVSVWITDTNNNPVKQLLTDTVLSAGMHNIDWLGDDNQNQVVADGDYLIHVSAFDPALPALVEDLQLPIKTDTMAPSLSINPVQPVIKGEGLLSVDIQEANPADNKIYLQVLEPLSAERLVLDQAGSGLFDVFDFNDLDETSYQLSGSLLDQAGNSFIFSHTFLIDRTAPTLEWLTPENEGIYGANDTLVLSGDLTEDNLSQYELAIAADSEPYDWQVITNGTEVVDNRFEHEWPINVEDGIYLLRALAIDDADWQTESIITITLDQTPPFVSFDAPSHQSTHGTNIALIGTATDQNLSNYTISYRIQGGTATEWRVVHSDVTAKTNEILLDWNHGLESGLYDVRLLAIDIAGQQSETVISLLIDSEPPLPPYQLTATLFNDRDARLSWQHPDVNDVAGFQVYRNGELITEQLVVATSLEDTGLPEGEFNYRVFAIDHFGNVSEGSNVGSVLVDTIAPEVTLINPLNQALVSGTVGIVGSVEQVVDLATAQLSYRMQGEPLPGTVIYQTALPVTAHQMFNLDTSLLIQEQIYLIRLQAEDVSGNLTSVEHAISIDNLPPNAPLNLTHQLMGSNQVNLSWTPNSESDLSGYVLFRNGVIISGGGSIESGQIQQTNYSDENVPDGSHSYYVVAVDHAGNISLPSNTVDVQINRRPPDAWFTSPPDGHEFEAPVFLHAISEDQDIATMLFEYSTDGSQWLTLINDSEAPFDAVLDANSLGLDFGAMQIRVTATDEGGQVDNSPDVRSIKYTDLTAPNPVEGLLASVIGGDITLSWTANSEPDLAGYLVSRKQVEPLLETDFTELTAIAISDPTYTDAGLTDGTYQYRVVAKDDFDNQSSAMTTGALTVFSVILEQPYSPVLTPADITFLGSSPQAGDLQLSLSNVNGTQALPPVTLDAAGEFETPPVTLSLDDNTLMMSVINAVGHQSKSDNKTVQVSEIPLSPINESGTENNFIIDYNWQSPDGNTIGFLPHLNGQSVFTEERLVDNVTFSASSFEYNAPLILDADENTFWEPDWNDVNNGEPVYLQLDFDSPQWLTSTQIQWHDDGQVNAPDTYLLQYLSNGVWITQADYSGHTSQQVTYQGDVPYLTTAVRIYMPLEANNYNNIRLTELVITQQPFTEQLSYSQTVADGEHLIQVSAINRYGFESALTSGLNITVGDVQPPESVILAGQVVDTYNAHLSWQSSVSADVAKYRLFRNDSIIYLTPDASVLSYQDAGLADGNYTYRVAAVDDAGNQSSLSNEVLLNIAREPIAAPQNLVIEAATEGGALLLSWDAVSDPHLAYYQIYRSQQANTHFEKQLQSNTEQTIDAVNNGITYYYYVTVVDTFSNESPPSGIVSGVARDLTLPEKPVILTPTTAGYPISVSHTKVDISGNATPNSEIDLFHNGQWTSSVNSSTDYLLTQTTFDDYYDNIRFNRVNDLIAYNDFMTGQIVIENSKSGYTVLVTLQNVKGQLNQWSHNGERLYVVSGYGNNSSLYKVDTNGTETQTSLVNTTIDFIDISSNENRAVYVGEAFNDVSQQTEYGLWLYDFALQTTEKITFNGDIQLSQDAFIWVNDDQQLLFINFANGHYNNGQLWRYSVQSQTLEQLDDITAAFATLTTDSQLNYVYYDDEDNGSQFITRLSLNDLSTVNFSMPDTETNMPVVGIDPDIALINIDCCEKALVNLLTGEILAEFSGFEYRTPALWRDDGRIIAVESEKKFIFIPPGYFVLKNVKLIAGANDFYVTARKSNGLLSEPSENININLLPESLPDLEILDHYIHLSPEDLSPNEALNGSIVIKNNGTVDVAQVSVIISLIKPDLSTELVLNSPIQASIAAGDVYINNFVLPGMLAEGEYSLSVDVDKGNQVIESNERNNSAHKTFFVLTDQQPFLELDLNQSNLSPQESLSGLVSVYNPNIEFNGSVAIKITDSQGYSVGFEQNHTIQNLANQQFFEAGFTWDTNQVFAGGYQVRATLYDENSHELSTVVRDITIGSFFDVDLNVYSTNNKPFQPGQIELNAEIDYIDGNVALAGHLSWEIKDSQNQVVWQFNDSLGQLNPGNQYNYTASWLADSPGQYIMTVTLTAPTVSKIATLPMTITPPQSNVEVQGSINTNGSDLILGEDFAVQYTIGNQGDGTLSNLPVVISLYNSDLSQLVYDSASVLTLAAHETQTQQFDWSTNGLNLDRYVLVLQVDLSAYGGGEHTILDTLTLDAVDGTPPTLDVITPVDGGYYQPNLNVRAQVTDTWSSVESVTVSLDGGAAIKLTNNSIDNQYEKQLVDLSEGLHQLDWSATDEVGQMTQQSTTFTVDATPPDITIDGVTESGLYAGTVNADILIVEENLATSNITLNGQAYVSGSDISDEGSYRLSAVATDLAGNRTQKTVTFTLDLTAPVVEITDPITNSEVNQELINVTGQTEVNSTVTLTSVSQTLTTVSDYQGQFVFADVILIEGENTLSVHAVDEVGNVGPVQSVQVTYRPPVNLQGSLTAPAEANLGAILDIEFIVENLSQIDLLQLPIELRLYNESTSQPVLTQSYSVDLAQQNQYQDTWQFDSTNLQKGSHRLQLWVNVDQQWQQLNEKLILFIDNTGPDIVINRPINNEYYGADIELSVLVIDQYSNIGTVSYQLDQSGQWEDMNFDGVNHVKSLSLPHGSHQVEFKAIDTENNESNSLLVDFNTDSQGPVIQINHPVDGQFYNQNITLDFQIQDDNTFTSTADLNGAATVNGAVISDVNVYQLDIQAEDEFSNASNKQIQFTIDKTAPVLNVTSPVDNAETNSSIMTFEGDVNESAEIELSLNGQTFNVLSTGLFSFVDVPLQPGENLYSLTATDQAGNASIPQDRTLYYLQTGQVSGHIWHDLNQDGLFNGNEVGLDQIGIELINNQGLVYSVQTDTAGYYTFHNVRTGDYTLTITNQTLVTEWTNTTANHPASVTVTADTEEVIDFGYYLADANLNSAIDISHIKGRLLIWTDPATATYDSNSCQGVYDWMMSKDVNRTWLSQDIIWAKLYDESGLLIQTEQISYVDMMANSIGIIDDVPESVDINLQLMSLNQGQMRARIHAASTLSPAIIPHTYYLELGIDSANGDELWRGGMIEPVCETWNQFDALMGDLILADVSLYPGVATDDPNSTPSSPLLRQQKQQLVHLLDNQGWSYHISDNVSDFETELDKGHYVAYILLSESPQISEQIQTKLSSALQAGDGLFIASGVAQLQSTLESELGVQLEGYYSQVSQLNVSDSDVFDAALLNLNHDEQVLKVSLTTGESVAKFIGLDVLPPADHAMIVNQSGDGRSFFAGLDLLLQATGLGEVGAYQTILLDAISYIQKVGQAYQLNRARLVRFSLQNTGRPVSGKVAVTLPVGVNLVATDIPTTDTVSGFKFNYVLAENEKLDFDFWLQINNSPLTVEFDVFIGTSSDIYEHTEIELIANQLPDLSVDISNCQAGIKPGGSVTYRYQVANKGNIDINGALANSNFSTELSSPSWTCEALNGAVCPQLNGTGNLTSLSIDLPVGGEMIFYMQTTVTGSVNNAAQAEASIMMPPDSFDVNPVNNVAGDVDDIYWYLFKNGFECAAPGQLQSHAQPFSQK